MFTVWILLLISTASSHDTDATTIPNTNITTLYPAFNKTITRTEIQTRPKDIETKSNDTETRFSDTETVSKDIETRCSDTETVSKDIETRSSDTETVSKNIETRSSDTETVSKNIETRSSDTETVSKDIETRSSDTEIVSKDIETRSNDTRTRSNDTKTRSYETETKANETETKSKPYHQTWKIESAFIESSLTEEERNTNDVKEGKEKKEILKEFKPSQHLGSFFDDDSAEVIKTPVFGLLGKKPASGFISSAKDKYHPTFNNIPKDIYQTHKVFPYKFEDTIFTRTKEGWQDSLESKPTVEVPVKVPAGGLYKSLEAFKKPNSDEDFGLAFHEVGEKENGVKKRVNPWQNLLRLVTAFIPVGLIISALTPSIITIHNVDDNQPSLPYRRSDAGMADMAPISEQCRRRLLCELHSDINYAPSRSSIPRPKMKHCYKIHCEDTEALWRMLRWLFTYNQSADDQRGRHFT